MNNLIDKARALPLRGPAVTVSVSPLTLPMLGRDRPLALRVTAPANGGDLPVVLLSHGHGPSLYIPSKDGYGPLASFYAEQGFAVIQPTHANSKVAGFPADAPGAPLFWRERVEELRAVLDGLDAIEELAAVLAGRLDRDRIAAIGHSLGGHTVALLLGARPADPGDEAARGMSFRDPRVKAGVLLAAPGDGGGLSEAAARSYPAVGLDFSAMTTRVLVVWGDADVSPHLTVRGADWHADAYRDGPGADALLTLHGAKHGLGGVAGYDARETDDENPDRLAVTQRMTAAYLRSALGGGDPAWAQACAALQAHASELARVDRRSVDRGFRVVKAPS